VTAQTSSSYNAATFRSRGIFFRQEYSNASTGTHKNGCLNTKLAD